ncbi:zinc-binding dehydrogenase [Streptomyces sp. B-S-A8]|uniref:Zinc-binding dehydrogenase n=1 Tax=Streptomyces solicavernae TaxID=3043614 RepID=A0ABT6RUV5_9ACTN|nr:zinc-binding dehydrogenase [Streptomyces sp. B-S-A8]MDI3388227.1 zinc-binding dehydrogenase [Streptomyces sp. B-S-A8]
MRAIRLHAFGPAENLVLEEVADPEPGPGQLRIAVEAAGVHLLDTAIRSGVPGPLPELPALPTVPGREVAGIVDAVGPGTDPAWLGRRAVTHLGFAPGGYAELTVVDADRPHEIPAGLDAAAAVAMIGTGRTVMGIVQFTDLDADSVVLVPAAAGGIGTLLVQYAKNAGATVVGLAGGPEKVALVEADGADLAVDYRQPDWPGKVRAHLGGRGATVVFDGVGGAAGRAAVELLGRDGTHVVFGWSSQGLTGADEHRLDATELARRGLTTAEVLGPPMLARAGGERPIRALELRALAEAAAGRLRPRVQRFPLAEAASAHAALEGRGTVGKVVLEP